MSPSTDRPKGGWGGLSFLTAAQKCEIHNSMPAGRPSLYKDEFVERVVEFCAQGYSLTGFAGEIGVDRDTISEWCSRHQEFSVACKRAKALRARWWEDRARAVASDGGPGGQATMVIFGLKNHAPEDYSDRLKHEHTGADGKDLMQAPDQAKIALAILALLQPKEDEQK